MIYDHVVDMKLADILKFYPDCKKLIFSRYSGMGKMIYNPIYFEKQKSIQTRVYFKKNKPIAWIWTFERTFIGRIPRDLKCTVENKSVVTRRMVTYIYVKSHYRKKGLGKELFQYSKFLAKRKHRPLVVYPWDDVSEAFFDSQGADFNHAKSLY